MAPVRSLHLLRSSRITSPQAFRPLFSHPLSTNLALRAGDDQKAAQKDREKMNTEPNEYAKSGTDAGVGGNEGQAAFDPSITDPQQAKKKAGEGNNANPLEASPANPEISQTTSEESGGAGKKRSETDKAV